MYVARVLRTDTGEILRNRVLDISCGVVKNIYSFNGETQSMILIDEACLFTFEQALCSVGAEITSRLCEGDMLYAFQVLPAGGFLLLE